MPKKLTPFVPRQILIDTDKVRELTDGHVVLDRVIDAFWALTGALISTFISWLTIPDNEESAKGLWLAALIVLLVFVICVAIIYLVLRKNKKPFDLIYKEAIARSKHTLIFVVADNSGNEKGFLSNKQTLFLPYDDVLPTANLTLSDDELKAKIAEVLKINSDEILDYKKLNKDGAIESVKPKDEGAPRLIRFDYYWIQLRESCKSTFSRYNSTYTWKPLSNLMSNPDAIFNNHDVVKYLRDHDNIIKDSFEKKTPLKVIWNITRECGLNCDMCATHSTNREELDLSQKRQVLRNLSDVGYYFTEFDFAGGDPLFKPESRAFILMAIKFLECKNYSITTTYKGVNELLNDKTISDMEKDILLNHCELTVDSDNSDSIRGESSYSDENYAIIKKIVKRMRNLNINIPITTTEISNERIASVAKRINELDIEKTRITINLLRLMPVGKFSLKKYPSNYAPHKYVEEFKKYINEDINVSVHCALRGALCDTNDNCGMAKNKVGIDDAGNVFACAWAGYISSKNVVDNPFYLGNLTQQSLADILQSAKAVGFIEKSKRRQDGSCRIFSYEQNKKADMFSTKDSLLISK